MPRSFWEWILCLSVLVFPWLLIRFRGRRDLAFLAGLVNVLVGCGYVLSNPAGEPVEAAVAACGILGFNVVAWFASASLERRLLNVARWRSAKFVLAILMATLVPLALTELACRFLTEFHVLKYYEAIHTVWRSGQDDWRLATITSDQCREPDPILLWRPLPRKPFNSQRFKGPVAQVPKPPEVVRIMCYGDSLTDGPLKGGWPSWLHRLLRQQPPVAGRVFEVINAGVAGYSSHQGLLRFLEEVDQYQPDLLTVSFGWNDAAEAVGEPDKSFRIPPRPLVLCQRALVRYRAYLVLMYYTRQWRAEPPAPSTGRGQPRVSVDDYLANLGRFQNEAQERGIPIVFLTRAHKLPPAELSQNPNWRGMVPRYNSALIAWAEGRGVPLIDVQQFFEHLPATLFSDECHFTSEGYERMAVLIRDRLNTGPDGSFHLGADGSQRPPAEGNRIDRSPQVSSRSSDRGRL